VWTGRACARPIFCPDACAAASSTGHSNADDAHDGQRIPTPSIEQYGATLAQWFGVEPTALAHVFPNLPAFAVKDLGFLG